MAFPTLFYALVKVAPPVRRAFVVATATLIAPTPLSSSTGGASHVDERAWLSEEQTQKILSSAGPRTFAQADRL